MCALPRVSIVPQECNYVWVLAITYQIETLNQQHAPILKLPCDGQVPRGYGTLAVHMMARYVLQNTMGQAVQYKQQNTSVERELLPGASRAVHWQDVTQPLRICFRMQEAGWLWSGGVPLDAPGDQFVNVRHR